MNDETQIWLKYSKENLDSAKILLDSKFFNPCLQNIHQVSMLILYLNLGTQIVPKNCIRCFEFFKTINNNYRL